MDGRFVAVDWGTTRLRAYLIGKNGVVLARAAADQGVQSVPPGGFPAVLAAACGAWFDAKPDIPVLMAGMVGSRNGWIEAPYVSPPCGPDELAAKFLRVDASRPVFIIPGVDCRSDDGGYDVMRGEETQAFGTGVADGLVCLPGTHSKWVDINGGRITRFATFVTGELYAALTQSFVGRLAQEPDDMAAGVTIAHAMAGMPGGLTRALFQARTQVLAGDMPGHAVRPYLSSVLIETEIRGARAMFGKTGSVHLVAGDPQRAPYAAALAAHGFDVAVLDPETATVAGLVRLAAMRGLDRESS